MKKLLPGLAFAGFFAAIIGTSFSAPAATPVADDFATYSGETTAGLSANQVDYVIHLEWSDYVLHLEWRDIEAAAATPIATDKLFDK